MVAHDAPHAPGDPTRALPAVALSSLDTVHCMDALALLRGLGDASVDAVITDPPYAEISRDYGRMTEPEWMQLMKMVTLELHRTLKPSGSALLILQPNSEFVGRMRPWLWDYLSWVSHEWNVIQDVYWWNFTPFPTVHSHRANGLMRPSVKYCVWLGSPSCYRNQDDVLWGLSDAIRAEDISDRALRHYPSGGTMRQGRAAQTAMERNGSTPINLIPISNANSATSAGASGHGAGTPEELISWWVRYITQPGQLILDPFMGSGSTAIVARRMGRHYIGCEKMSVHFERCMSRLKRADPYQSTQVAPGVVQHSLFEVAS